MTSIHTYLQDGTAPQARAVLCMLQGRNIDESFDPGYGQYRANIKVAPWEYKHKTNVWNHYKGYVISLWPSNIPVHDPKQINIALFEESHPHGKGYICAFKWEGELTDMNPSYQFKELYPHGFPITHKENYGEILKMADWIFLELERFWRLSEQVD